MTVGMVRVLCKNEVGQIIRGAVLERMSGAVEYRQQHRRHPLAHAKTGARRMEFVPELIFIYATPTPTLERNLHNLVDGQSQAPTTRFVLNGDYQFVFGLESLLSESRLCWNSCGLMCRIPR